MAKREPRLVETKVYVTAFIVTALIFSLGLLLGMTLENERQKVLTDALSSYRDDLETMYIQSLLVGKGKVTCESYPIVLSKSYKDLDDLGIKLDKYQKEERFSDPEFNELKKRYMTLSVRTWLYLQSIKEYCPKEYVTVIYFYSTKDCADCTAQGVVLDDLKKQYKMNILTFSIDAGYDDITVKSLTALYNITKTPSMVIDEEVTSGFKEKVELKQILCKHLEKFC